MRDSQPTAKQGRGAEGRIDISGSRLFFDRVQMGDNDEEIASAQLNQDGALAWSERILRDGLELHDQGGHPIGKMINNVEPLEVADFLDGFRFTFHNPNPASGIRINVRDFYRMPYPAAKVTDVGLSPPNDPYFVAAYLRFWANAYRKCQENRSNNRHYAADDGTRWVSCSPPMFNFVVRFGSLPPAAGSPFHHDLLNRGVSRTGEIGSRWGGHGSGSDGDEWIDIRPPRGDRLEPRQHGTPALALLHVISRDAVGRNNDGARYRLDRPTLGIVVPEGGPCMKFVLAEPGG